MQTGLPDPAGAVQLPKPDKLVLAGLLIDGEFAELERRLAGYQEQFEAGQITDYRVGFAFSAFANSDPRVTRGLGRWVEESPDSYVPYLARSVHHANLAKHVRGTAFYNRTSEKAFEKMREYFALAVADSRKALSFNRKLTKAYAVLLDATTYSGPHRDKRKILDEALKHAPRSLLVRDSYLVSLRPWWGGSLEEIRAFLEESRQSGVKLGPLEGFADYIKAETLARRGQRWEAIEHYDRALKFGESARYRFARAQNLYWGNLGDHGIKDSAKAVKYSRQWKDALALRAKILTRARKRKAARKFWDSALRLDPLDPDLLKARAFWFRQLNRYEDALADYDRALVYGAFDVELYLRRGGLNLTYNRGQESAQSDFRRAIELDPDNAEARLAYAESLTSRQPYAADCRAIEAFQSFLDFCARSGLCDNASQKHARWFVDDQTGVMNKCTKAQ